MTTHNKVLAACALLGAIGFAQRVSTQPQNSQPARSNTEVSTFHVQGNVYTLVGAGANIAVQRGDDGVLVVDTGLALNAEKVLAAIRTLSDKPIRWMLNTHFHPDHTGGNAAIAKAGSKTTGGPAEVLAHENVLTRMSAPAGKASPTPTATRSCSSANRTSSWPATCS